MASVLGKRKLAAPKPDAGSPSDADTIQDIFRRHFEAQFQPLQTRPKKAAAPVEPDEDEDEDEEDLSDSENSDWSGLGDDDDDDDNDSSVQVIDYSKSAQVDTTTMTKQERKAYLSSRPLAAWDDDADGKPSARATTAAAADSDPQDAPDLLANDLALQRLLAESHLLAGGRAAPALSALANPLKSQRPFAAGRLRQRATDLRVQVAAANKGKGQVLAGSAKNSIFTQTSMPMAIRKGIAAAATARETKRRREARESGIVLERPSASSASSASASTAKDKRRRRLRAIDAPAVGRLHGSELRLRDRDVRAIQGPPRSGPGNKKRKRR